MFEFIIGAVAGIALAVLSPPVYRWGAALAAKIKAEDE